MVREKLKNAVANMAKIKINVEVNALIDHKYNTSQKGITLIALVITIIILLILAGVTINATIGNNGIFNKVKQAAKQTEIENIKEQIQAEILSLQIAKQGNISETELKAILQKYGKINYDTDKATIKGITTKQKGYEILIKDIYSGTVKKIANEPNISGFNKEKTFYVVWDLNEAKTEYIPNPVNMKEVEDKRKIIPDNWYDYEKGQWANIKTTNKVSDTEILEAYWVWIPRYEYKVPASTQTTATEIDVKFIPTSKTEPDAGYTIHPAFTNEGNGGFGDLDGIWVAKFEASSNTTTPDTNYGGGNDTNLKVQVKPGVQSWRNITSDNIFTVCRKMTNEGEVLAGGAVDSHMMKNTEWGAVAILSQSKYGIFNSQSSTGANGDSSYQIWNNSNGYNTYKNVYTGYAGNSKNASTTYDSTTASTNVYEYNTINGTKASTTGTVYGIYDMAGGSWEYVAGCLNGYENSKFGITEEKDKKYVDLYTSASISDYSGAKIGDATKETKGWNSDYSNFVYSSHPVFERGRWLWC